MILEDATVTVHPGREADFISALERATPIVAGTPGFIGLELRRGIERPNVFKLLIRWENLEAHTVNFRESSRFPEWRAQIGEFFLGPPSVEHFLEPAVTA